VPKIEMLSNRGQQSQSMDPSREIKRRAAITYDRVIMNVPHGADESRLLLPDAREATCRAITPQFE